MSTVFVKNISYKASSEEFGKAFEKYGPIKRAFILTQRFRGSIFSLGKGFVEFETADAMRAAIADTGKVSINDRALVIEEAKPRRPRVTAFILGIPKGTTKEQILDVFKAYKAIDARIVFENTDGEKPRLGFGFVKFESEKDLEDCVKAAEKVQLNGAETTVRFARRPFDARPRRPNFRRNRRGYKKAPKN